MHRSFLKRLFWTDPTASVRRVFVQTRTLILIMLMVHAVGAAEPASEAPVPTPAASTNTRYGPFNLFDSRSSYGVGVFPEPFLVDDSDLEVNEIRLDWVHQEGKGSVSDGVTGEIEKGFGLLTLEVEVPYEWNESGAFDPDTGHTARDRSQGFDNVDLGARIPFFQYVSPDGGFDTTFGTAIEVGIPTNSPVSKNTEVVPKLFNDTRIGDHITVQTIIGYSMLLGGGDDGGSNAFEYGLDLGYTISHQDLPLAGIDSLIPLFEISGETALNHDDSGANALAGVAALRVNMRAVGRFQPRLGVGYIFPIDQGARDDFRWGIVTSLVFEF